MSGRETLELALIAGPMYEALDPALDAFAAAHDADLRVVFRGDHPALNRHLASHRDLPYDLISTHSKYAPSQRHLLAPLDGVIADDHLADVLPSVLAMARVDGELYGIPRNLDVRLLHHRTDLGLDPFTSWESLAAQARAACANGRWGFALPGCESGLFGTFYELAAMAGAAVFPGESGEDVRGAGGRWALDWLRGLWVDGALPPQTPTWHYEDVSACFRAGGAAVIADWPGSYAAHLDPARSSVADRVGFAAYPQGPAGRSLSYGGSHTFALTSRGVERPLARELLRFLTAPAQQRLDADAGNLPVRRSLWDRGRLQARSDPRAHQRWLLLEEVVENGLLVPPFAPNYPQVEAVIWRSVQAAMLGEVAIPAALERIAASAVTMAQRGAG